VPDRPRRYSAWPRGAHIVARATRSRSASGLLKSGSNGRTVQFDIAVFFTFAQSVSATSRDHGHLRLVSRMLSAICSPASRGREVHVKEPAPRISAMIELEAPCRDPSGNLRAVRFFIKLRAAVLGLILGLSAGGARHGAGLAWVEFLQTTDFEGTTGCWCSHLHAAGARRRRPDRAFGSA